MHQLIGVIRIFTDHLTCKGKNRQMNFLNKMHSVIFIMSLGISFPLVLLIRRLGRCAATYANVMVESDASKKQMGIFFILEVEELSAHIIQKTVE